MGRSQLKWIADAETQPAGGALEVTRLSLEGPALMASLETYPGFGVSLAPTVSVERINFVAVKAVGSCGQVARAIMVPKLVWVAKKV
jgi:hypothetical protein